MFRRDGKRKPDQHLTPEELIEFRLRKAALDQARAMFMMVEEAYRAWTIQIKDKYGLPAQYDIDVRTGRMTPKEHVTRS